MTDDEPRLCAYHRGVMPGVTEHTDHLPDAAARLAAIAGQFARQCCNTPRETRDGG